MNVRLAADLQTDSVVDGKGIRTVIWMQGCSHNCPFCHNPQTHDFNKGVLVDLDIILDDIKNLEGQDGITLSGGDPLFQLDASIEIAKCAKENNLNVWCYTGFTFEKIMEMNENNPKYLELLNYIDVLVDGKFEIENRDLNLMFRGSSNQRLIDVRNTLINNKIITLEENDYIIDSFISKELVYI